MAFSLPFFVASAALATRRSSNIRFTSRQWIAVAAVGICGYYVSSILDFKGLQFVSAGIERLILFVYPTFVLIMSAWWRKQNITRQDWSAVGITYAGLLIAFWSEASIAPASGNFYLGALLILLCAVTYATYIVTSGALIPSIGAVKFNSYAMSFAGAAVVGHFVIFSEQSLLGLPAQVYLYSLLMAVIATIIPTYLISFSIKRLGGNTTAVVASIGPVSTILQAYVFLDENITTFQVIGTVLVLAGIVVITRRPSATNKGSSAQ